MPEPLSLPDDDQAADGGQSGIAALAQAALSSPNPAPDAEREARDRALAQFQEMSPAPRPLRPEAAPGSEGRASWVRSVLRRLRRK